VGRHDEYAELFPAMIEDWRRTFRQPDLPFYFVQLANFVGARAHREHDLWADLREAQTAALQLPHTEMISAIDIGESNNIHPSNKQEVGRRLARHALKQVYGKELGLVHGPRFAAAKRNGQEVRVTFAYAEGLRTTDGEAPLSFELAGRDGKFVAARASIDGDGIRVVAKSVSEPAFVRYAWKNDPKVNTVNAAGLPLEPFRAEIL